MTRLLPFIALALAMAVAASCGDSSKSGAATATPQSSGAARQPSSAASAASSSPASTSSPGSGQVSGSGASTLKKLSTDLSGKTYQVSCDINIVPSGGAATKGSMTLSQKPPKTATSIQLTAGATETIIDDGTYTYICSSTSSNAGQCAKSKTGSTANPLAIGFSLDSFLKNREHRRYDGRKPEFRGSR